MDAFFWYPDDWIGSTHRRQMDHAEQNGYFLLLCHAAKNDDGGLPDNDYELAGLSELGPLWNEKPKGSPITRGERIRRCFSAQDGKLFNARLLREFERRRQYKESRTNSAKTAANARWAGKRKGASVMRDASVTHPPRHADAMRQICNPRPESIVRIPPTPLALVEPERVGVRINDADENGDGIRWYTRAEALDLIRLGAEVLAWPVPDDLGDLALDQLGWKLERIDKALTGWGVAPVADGYNREAEWREFLERNGWEMDERELEM